MWLDEAAVKDWQEKPYPKTSLENPIIPFDENLAYKSYIIHGMMYDNLYSFDYPDVKYVYTPGISSIQTGTGLTITKKSKFKDEAFKFFEIMINSTYPFYSYGNTAMTPVEDVSGYICASNNQKTKIELCNSLLDLDGAYPYYYIENNKTNIIYLNHTFIGYNRGIIIDNLLNNEMANNKFKVKEYSCDNSVDFSKKKITYNEEYKIEVPISNDEVIILKSMRDIESFSVEQNTEQVCSIYEDTFKKAKPMQFPYTNFMETNNLDSRGPISLFFAHLYYKHNETEEGSLQDIVNECCDIIDDSLIPSCKNTDKIIFSVDVCDEARLKMKINYLNCKNATLTNLQSEIDCVYMPLKNIYGIILIIFIVVSLLINIVFSIIIIKNRDERCIYISGIKLFIYLLISSLLLNISIFLWIGKTNMFRCILKIWTMISAISGFICTSSSKMEMIVSTYYNEKLSNVSLKYKNQFIYTIMPSFQIIFLLLWTFTQTGTEIKTINIKNVGNYEYTSCSTGIEILLKFIFIIDFVLLFFSITISYRGRNIPDEFNDSKKIFVTSIMFLFQKKVHEKHQ
ncbi:hypothetical protein BCR32DRAFT_106102 [Anaeromyces robustus]|uniref:G-protein coupled receptors family 3 profile domain-containing protein n=1 Tax=Anaeromyces robustus TaxID=1754192 RepID=A0A1Y1W8Z6_9FUNG|nr:hypothetical protein BCR32DRAFT_106102 [Anaeromyces robustus]|eukprot:ORX69808.1 hypothetical protein BCR32DRAFT_106102 [Anaeromyces robustus]